VATDDVGVGASYQFPKPWVVLLFLVVIATLATLAEVVA
jgi:hypothetical protein